MKVIISFEDPAVSVADVKAVLQNSPLDLGWFTIEEAGE